MIKKTVNNVRLTTILRHCKIVFNKWVKIIQSVCDVSNTDIPRNLLFQRIQFEHISYFMYISTSGPEVIKLFFMLNSVEHGILNAYKYKNIKNFGLFSAQISVKCYFSRS